jgi:serine/threonine protein kinase
MVSEGDLLAGKYRVERVLGVGGMGYVVAALHEQLEQRVAVKLLVPELAEDQDAAARFLREARAAVRIQSEHVARVLDVGELDNGAPYMVMEFLSGRDVARELEAVKNFEIGTAIDYVLQACEAVAEAHAIGVIHRDLKPANLFLTRRADGSPLVKVLDFGISKAITLGGGPMNASPSLTAAQSLLGSPAYMSPEQARRPKSVDTRTDIWALGVILYEFLTGETPFPGESPLEVLTAALADPMPSIWAVRQDVPRELEAVVAKCLEKRPDDRHQTVAEFAEALRPFAPAESMRSISRISGILRSVAPPSPEPGTTTLRSTPARTPNERNDTPNERSRKLTPNQPVTRKEGGSARPRGDDVTELSGDSVPPSRGAKDTQTGFGRSQPQGLRSRRLALYAVAGGLALLGGGFFVVRGALDGAPATQPGGAAATQPGVTTPENHETAKPPQPRVEVVPSAPVVVTSSAAAEITAEVPNGSAATPSASAGAPAVPRTSHTALPAKPVGPLAKPNAAAPSAPKPSAKPQTAPTPRADTEDPLENRH